MSRLSSSKNPISVSKEAGVSRLLAFISLPAQICGVSLFGFLLWHHVGQMQKFISIRIWLMEGILYFGLLLAYLLRKPALVHASKPVEILLPPVCALLPFSLMIDWERFFKAPSSLSYARLQNIDYYYVIEPLMLLGTLITIAGITSLRGSFSILTEVRPLVTGGIYRYVTHPMYLGEAIAATASAMLRAQPDKWCLLVLFLVLQYWRLKNEEAKLREVHFDYDEWKKNTLIKL
jgi:hypothetical protein